MIITENKTNQGIRGLVSPDTDEATIPLGAAAGTEEPTSLAPLPISPRPLPVDLLFVVTPIIQLSV